jgi:acetate kinase
MGFTPLEGLPMASPAQARPQGAFYLLEGTDAPRPQPDARARVRSPGLSAPETSGSWGPKTPGPAPALAVFAPRRDRRWRHGDRARRLDALVFTAGIGENSASVRAAICARLGFLGVEIDDGVNAAARPDAGIAAAGTSVQLMVLEAREDVVAARAARQLLAL